MPSLNPYTVATAGIRTLIRALAAGLFFLTATLVACEAPPRQPSSPTPTSAPIVFATPAPTFTPLGGPTLTPTRSLTPTLTLVPLPTRAPLSPLSPLPLDSPVPGSTTVYVANTEGQGVSLRKTPGGDPITAVGEGTALTTTGEEQVSDDRLWKKVRDRGGNVGWVAAEYLVESDRPLDLPTSTPFPLRPTFPVELIPTATYGTPQRAPTRTPLPSPTPRSLFPGAGAPLIQQPPAATPASVDSSPSPRR